MSVISAGIKPTKVALKKGTEVASELIKDATGAYEGLAALIKKNIGKVDPANQAKLAGGELLESDAKKLLTEAEIPTLNYSTIPGAHTPTVSGKKVPTGTAFGETIKKGGVTGAAAAGIGLGATLAANNAKAADLAGEGQFGASISKPKGEQSSGFGDDPSPATAKEQPIPSPLVKKIMEGKAKTTEVKKALPEPEKPPVKVPEKEKSAYDILMERRERIVDSYDRKQNNQAWLEVAENMAHALTKYAAARDGFNKGIDMSGIKMTPTDWSRFDKRTKESLVVDLELIDIGLKNLKEEQAGIARGAEKKEDREFRKGLADDANRSRERAAGLKSTGPTYEQKRADRIADEASRHGRNLSEREMAVQEKERKQKVNDYNQAQVFLSEGGSSKKLLAKLSKLKLDPEDFNYIQEELNKGHEGVPGFGTYAEERISPKLKDKLNQLVSSRPQPSAAPSNQKVGKASALPPL